MSCFQKFYVTANKYNEEKYQSWRIHLLKVSPARDGDMTLFMTDAL